MLPTDTTDSERGEVSRRHVLGSVGAAGVGATGLTGATASANAACEPRWQPEACAVTVEDTLLLEGCGDDGGTTVPAGTEALLRDYTCCGESGVYYYVEWCEANYPDGLVAQAALELTPSCCGSCSFRWPIETCVATTGFEVPIYGEECAAEPQAVTTSGARGIVHERICCEVDSGLVPRYLVEWCTDELPPGWVDQSALTVSNGCCGDCEPRWTPDTCVETAVDGVPIFEEACVEEPIDQLPRRMQATILEGDCCDGPVGPTPGYYVEWCDPDLPVTWIRQADLVESSGCCGACEPRWNPETCVETAVDEAPIFEEECTGEPIERLPQGVQATVLEGGCCEGADGPTPGYYVEWCDPDLPVAWIRQSDLVASSGCCDSCTFEWDIDDCVQVSVSDPPIFESACGSEPVVVEAQAIVADRRCCEIDGEYHPRYALQWCDSSLPDGWVGPDSLSAGSGCCGGS
ncbi:hypothetical protein C479_11375 [Halovivax asiaticus JCM 14624]|uniref:Uncharacterized protein n=1 Tax=Halovivax asiaticus JCM 14624 TaxID=1227490 RepID=M0BG35_9EURY|nr:hypothetical protein [Halovivax asiaticus]ELZ09417.1 hypothetical protein C479_11375 [Halovivax asiaticus JCM 14624]